MAKLASFKPADLKFENKTSILQFVYSNGITSKTDICKTLGMSKPTASLLVQELVDHHLLIEAGYGDSTNQGGKKPQLYEFNSNAGAVIALFIGIDSLQGALINLGIKVLFRIKIDVGKETGDQLLSNISEIVEQLIVKSEQSGLKLFGIGVSAPGIIESKKGILINATHLEGLSDVQIGPHLQDKFDLPVWVNNESRNMAIAEKWFGVGKTAKTLIALQTNGGGLGTGIIIENEIYQGKDNSGGEFGHTTIDIHGPVCRCGNIGCWELYASEEAFLARFKQAPEFEPFRQDLQLQLDKADLNFTIIAQAYKDGNAYASTQVNQYAEYLAVGMVNLVNVFNPDMIILRGDLMALQEPFLKKLESIVIKRALLPAGKRVVIRFSELTEDTRIIGAATLVIKEVIQGHI